ncbi:MAG: hypothetical protein AB7K71_09545 [Polyangiaceae bacterium]
MTRSSSSAAKRWEAEETPVTFGTGAGNQTYIDSDGGQFDDAVVKYYASPVALP